MKNENENLRLINSITPILLLSIMASKIISNFFGKLILETPLNYASNPNSLGITFLVMLVVLLLSAYFPIRNALKMEIKEALK